jgi:transposase
MRRLGMPVSDTTILTVLKKHAGARSENGAAAVVRVAGVDDWAWRKGHNYGTIIVDLERREVVDVTLYETVRLRRFWTFAAGNGETRKGLSLVFAANTRMSDGRRRAA